MLARGENLSPVSPMPILISYPRAIARPERLLNEARTNGSSFGCEGVAVDGEIAGFTARPSKHITMSPDSSLEGAHALFRARVADLRGARRQGCAISPSWLRMAACCGSTL